MDDLLDLYKRYISGEYDIGDVSRMLSYIAIPNLGHEYIRQVENQIEWIQFMTDEKDQKEKVLTLLDELIDRNTKDNWKDGIVSLGNGLIISPGYAFSDFKKTSFYTGQDGGRQIILDGSFVIDGHKYAADLVFIKENCIQFRLFVVMLSSRWSAKKKDACCMTRCFYSMV